MSASQLATNWICIATAGETVDKRAIEEQWLLDAAELYDPSLYTALLSDVQEDVDTVKEVVDTEDFARLVGNLPELVKNFSKLNSKVTQLPDKKFSKGKKGFNFL
ncbi:GPO family capsid scaffolding protein [Salmonella enterica]|nr:hypothetical protein [Salmonella enterica]EDU6917340.1 hypothetical protein [Salmonella enterica subsp. enterica serovar Miami]EKM5144366.1 GPO family capsid scaffolding protein [Salmonella enterica]ELM7420359.1 GPO family capsid scaffolding protein [Salmonella enterica]ELU6390524.1 GPO family capsid scaffolding protein [Salmonella enterica]